MKNRYLDFTLEAPVDLVANTKYWIGIVADDANGTQSQIFFGFSNQYSTQLGLVGEDAGTTAPQTWPNAAGLGSIGEYAYWFRIYDPAATFLIGPQGVQGPQGSSGITGPAGAAGAAAARVWTHQHTRTIST